MLTGEQFERTRRLALRLAGIELLERHRELLQRRCRRIEMLKPASLDALLCAAEADDPAARRQFVGLITTKFTGFFRHARQFELAAEHAVRAVRQRGHARLWSAGAATGEEPYSLAMMLIEVFQPDDPPAIILATDVDVEALATAQRGEYGAVSLRTLSPARQDRFLNESSVPQRRCVAPAVRRLVEFRTLNLAGEDWPIDSLLDVIFCRNVLMYLEACYRYAVLERMASLLAPDGLLMLDPAEHLGKAGPMFTSGGDGVYSRRNVAPRREKTRTAGILAR